DATVTGVQTCALPICEGGSVTSLLWGVVLIGLLMAAVAAEATARWWIRHRRRYYVLPPGLRLRMYPDPKVFPQLERVARFDVNRSEERRVGKEGRSGR